VVLDVAVAATAALLLASLAAIEAMAADALAIAVAACRYWIIDLRIAAE
jgi:hypothetical protein